MTSSMLRRVGWSAFSGVFTLAALLTFWAAVPVTAKAQLSSAAINGGIKDTTEAVIPGATVVLENVATGVKHTVTSNATGDYVLLDVLPGDYTLQVSKEGFTTVTQAKFTLYVNQTATFDFTLAVATTLQTLTVKGETAYVEASTSELGVVIGGASVVDLPLNGRNFTELLGLAAGASPANVSQNCCGADANPIGAFMFPAVNGANNRSNIFMIDGILDEGNYLGTYSVPPIVDSIQEFKLESHNDEAQFGGAFGGIVNVATKSGTNSFHGDAWEFMRNTVLDARNFFLPSVSPFVQNMFGGTFGGPVILPHLYNGRNKTFFYAAYEGFRLHAPSSSLGLAPTPTELTGDLSDLTDVVGQIYNPYSTRPDPSIPGEYLRDPFMCDGSGNALPTNAAGLQTTGTPCNVLPSSLINQGAVIYSKAIYPTPINTGVPGTNYIDMTPTYLDQNEFSLRGDQQIGARDSIFVRYEGFRQPSGGSCGIPGTTACVSTASAYQTSASWIHTFSGNSMAQVSFGRVNTLDVPLTQFTSAVPANLLQQVGIASSFACGHTGLNVKPCYFPPLIPSGYASSGERAENDDLTSTYEWKADFSKVRGHHTFKVGTDLTTIGLNTSVAADDMSFVGYETSNLETSLGGSSLASFLLGIPDSSSYENTVETTHGMWIYGFYFADQWRATNRLTVNWGLRYDLGTWPSFGNLSDGTAYIGDENLQGKNGIATYELQNMPPACSATQLAPCLPGGTLPANVYLAPGGKLFHDSHDDFGPRLGLAYRLGNTWALRGSYGRFYDMWTGVTQIATNVKDTWPSTTAGTWENLNPYVPTVFLQNPTTGSGRTYPAATPFLKYAGFADPYQVAPHSDQWNVGLQRMLGSSTVVTANFVGSRSGNLDVGARYNTAIPGPGLPCPQDPDRCEFSNTITQSYQRHIGRATYNAFQLTLDKKATHGLTYLLTYTWSKSIDVPMSGYFYEGSTVMDPNNINADKAVSGYDLTHMFNFSWVYQLPFGKGQRWSTGSRGLNYLVGNWQVNGILALDSGAPYYIYMNGDIANTGNAGSYNRLNLVGNPNLATPTQAEWFNTAAFVPPAEYTFGNEGRDILRQTWTKNLDLSIFRSFPITGSKRLEFRAEAFNFPNYAQMGEAGNVYGNPNYGMVTGTANTQRQVQLALKLYF